MRQSVVAIFGRVGQYFTANFIVESLPMVDMHVHLSSFMFVCMSNIK